MESIYALQNSERYKLLVDSLYENNGSGQISFSPDDNVLVKLFRQSADGAVTYHFDLYSGSGGSGYYLEPVFNLTQSAQKGMKVRNTNHRFGRIGRDFIIF